MNKAGISKVMIVEDELTIYMELKRKLEAIGLGVVGTSGKLEEAMEKLLMSHPDLILMDVLLKADYDGLFMAEIMRAHSDRPIVLYGSQGEGDQAREGSLVLEEFDLAYASPVGTAIKHALKTKVAWQVKGEPLISPEDEADNITELMKKLFQTTPETALHSYRMKWWAQAIGRELGLMEDELQELGMATLLHDIGKLNLPNQILFKPGPLEPQEWEIMEKHSSLGAQMVKGSPGLDHLANTILHHHEKWDGTGYPQGLKGREIPLYARIVALVDAYDSMTHERVYAPKKQKKWAIEEIRRKKGTHFDPSLTVIFLGLLDRK